MSKAVIGAACVLQAMVTEEIHCRHTSRSLGAQGGYCHALPGWVCAAVKTPPFPTGQVPKDPLFPLAKFQKAHFLCIKFNFVTVEDVQTFLIHSNGRLVPKDPCFIYRDQFQSGPNLQRSGHIPTKYIG